MLLTWCWHQYLCYSLGADISCSVTHLVLTSVAVLLNWCWHLLCYSLGADISCSVTHLVLTSVAVLLNWCWHLLRYSLRADISCSVTHLVLTSAMLLTWCWHRWQRCDWCSWPERWTTGWPIARISLPGWICCRENQLLFMAIKRKAAIAIKHQQQRWLLEIKNKNQNTRSFLCLLICYHDNFVKCLLIADKVIFTSNSETEETTITNILKNEDKKNTKTCRHR